MRIGRVTTVGVTAHAALVRAGGVARVYAPLSASIYMTAGDEIIWLGPHDGTPHGRAVLCADTPLDALGHAPRVAGATIAVDVGRRAPWRPRAGPRTPAQARAMIAGARRLGADLRRVGAPDGFAPLLEGVTPAFPLHGARERAHALATACMTGDAEAAAAAAIALLGLGAGLTPSGDDFAGAAFFARTLLASAGVGDSGRWRAAGDTVLRAAPALTHPISVALLGDLLAGAAHAPLHDLAHALATDAPPADAARRLSRLGHTSGWDMLAGFVAGAAGLPC